MSLYNVDDDCLLHLTSWLSPLQHQLLSITCSQLQQRLQHDEFWKQHLNANGIRPIETSDVRGFVLTTLLDLCSLCLRRKGKIVFQKNDDENWKDQICKQCTEIDALITKTRSKSEYKLTEKDIQSLPFVLRPNPRYKCASPMTLFLTSDVINLSHQKHGGKEGLANKIAKSENIKLKRQQTKDNKISNRKKVLQDALSKHGLTARSDSKLCASYIQTGCGNMEDIVSQMLELHFLHTYTKYKSILDDGFRNRGWDDTAHVIKLESIEKAIEQWVTIASERDMDKLPKSLVPLAKRYQKKRKRIADTDDRNFKKHKPDCG